MTTRTDAAVCMLCEAICGLEVEHDGRTVSRIRGDPHDAFSRGHICPKGVFLTVLQNDPARLRRPLLRDGERWHEIGWAEALERAAAGLEAVQAKYGRDAVAIYAGNPVSQNYATLFHGRTLGDALGTRNRFSTASIDGLPRQIASFELYGNQTRVPVPDLDRTQHFVMLGANPAVSNGSGMTAPGVVRRLRAIRERGGRVIVIDPRRTETAALADEHHFIRPGADAMLLAAWLHVLFAEDLVRPGHLAARLDGLDDARLLVAGCSPARVASRVGIEADVIARLAREFAAAPRAVCYGRLGTCVQEFGTLTNWLIDVINLATGNLDREGGALFATPAVDLPALARVFGQRGSLARWHSRVRGLPESSGEFPVAALAEEIETPGPGQVRALVTHAGNPVLSLPNGRRLERGLASLEFMLAIDIQRNETTRHANLILPPTFGLERDHYPLISHGLAVRNTAHYARALLAPAPGSLHDWEILLALAERVERARGGTDRVKAWLRGRLGRALSPRRLLALALALGPHRLSRSRLERAPHGLDLGPLEPRIDGWPRQQRIRVVPDRMRRDWPRLEATLADTPSDDATHGASDRLLLVSRRTLRRNNSWMHARNGRDGRADAPSLRMHPQDAARRSLVDGQRVRVASRTGEVRPLLQISDEMMPGVVSLPHGHGEGRAATVCSGDPRPGGGISINDLTDDARVDALSGTANLSGVEVWVSAEEG